MALHPSVLGFQSASGAYERARPGYPDAAVRALVEAIGAGPGRNVLEIGAGTGKLTRLLVPTGAVVTAIEPIAAMRETLRQLLPGVSVMEGTAEKLPLSNGSVDAVVVAQAFHWFDGAVALAEIRRVLRPGGGLGLIWNIRDESSALQRALTEVIAPYESGTPRFASGQWRDAFEASAEFTGLQEAHFAHEQRGDLAMVIERVLSISFIATLPASKREQVAGEVRRVVEALPEAADPSNITLRYRTSVFWCRSVAG